MVCTSTVALVGNPNTGKTTLFNALAGMNQRVGNYPGVTVETKKGRLRLGSQALDLIDLPGTYSLAPRSPDEMLAVELILGQTPGEPRPGVVVAIVDAANLERNLYLVTQIMELGVPIVVALNMIDVAARQGIHIDAARLSQHLGVPVVPIQANKGRGLDKLKEAIVSVAGATVRATGASRPVFPPVFEDEVRDLSGRLGDSTPTFFVRRLLLDVGGYTERLLNAHLSAHRGDGPEDGDGLAGRVYQARQRLAQAGCPVPAIEARTRYQWIRQATTGCVQRPAQRPVTLTDRLDRVLTHKLWGTLFFLGLMFLVFQSIFIWAKPVMGLISAGKDGLGGLIKDALDAGPFRGLLVDGVVNGVGGVLVFLPQIMILFAFIAVLEDCGYMARAAYLMDKLMARCGLSGKSFIPLLSSVACAVPGIMSARVIENPRDRLTTILVAPLMSCSARLPVYLLLIGAFLSPARGFAWWVPGVTLFGMYAVGLIVAPLVALVLKRTLLRGATPVFVMEMPLYKVPSPWTVARRTADAAWMFVRRAGTIILATMIVVWSLLYFPSLDAEGQSYDVRAAELEEKLAEPREKRADLQDQAKSLRGQEHHKARIAEIDKAIEALDEHIEPLEAALRDLQQQWRSQSWLGRMGRAVEPAVEPLGWDWRIGMAALASFPAREVFVGSMGIIFGQGEGAADDEEYRSGLGRTLRDDPVFSVPVALSVMVFFALCCQCASTLAVIRRETRSWRWPLFTFTYMTGLAYVGALVTYQLGRLFL